MNCVTVFAKELDLIANPMVREWVRVVFDDICPDYFWTIPASQSSHHPAIARGEGGLVRHTKLAVRFAHSFMEAWPDPPETSHDEVIAAVLLHDMLKRGAVEDELQTFPDHTMARQCHGLYCADYISSHCDSSPHLRALLPADRIKRIVTAVRDHMGKWTASYNIPHGDFVVQVSQKTHVVCITTHMADYAASRHLDQWLEDIAK